MKRLVGLFVVLALVCSAPLYAAKGGEKGASERAYEHASDQAIFNRVSDWFSTIGKSGSEKDAALAERKAERAAKRAEREAKKLEKKGHEKLNQAKAFAQKKNKG